MDSNRKLELKKTQNYLEKKKTHQQDDTSMDAHFPMLHRAFQKNNYLNLASKNIFII